MQTFLPYPHFGDSVRCLDWRRLGKQRVEAMQILKALRGETKGWVNHPATKMWKGYEEALGQYMNYCIEEWIARGYNNNMQFAEVSEFPDLPPWIGDEKFHKSHKSNLLRKDSEWYSTFEWDVSDDLPYVWPVS